MINTVLKFGLIIVLMCGTATANWHEDFSTRELTYGNASVYVSNIVEAIRERHPAGFRNTAGIPVCYNTNGAIISCSNPSVASYEVVITNQFAWSQLDWKDQFTVYDYANPVACGVVTSVANGVTSLVTRFCPGEEVVVTTNQVINPFNRSLLLSMLGTVNSMLSSFADYRHIDTNALHFNLYFESTQAQSIPILDRTIYAHHDYGTSFIDTSFSTNEIWAMYSQPTMTNTIWLANASFDQFPTKVWIETLADNNLSHDYSGQYTWNGQRYIGDASEIGWLWGAWILATSSEWDLIDDDDFWLFFIDVYYIQNIKANECSLYSSYYGFGVTNDVLCVASNSFFLSPPETYIVPQTNFLLKSHTYQPQNKISPLPEYKEKMPHVLLSYIDTNAASDTLTITIEGMKYIYTNSIGIGIQTNGIEQVTLTNTITSLTNKFVTITNIIINAPENFTNVNSITVLYEIEQALLFYFGDEIGWVHYKELFLCLYDMLSNMKYSVNPETRLRYRDGASVYRELKSPPDNFDDDDDIIAFYGYVVEDPPGLTWSDWTDDTYLLGYDFIFKNYSGSTYGGPECGSSEYTWGKRQQIQYRQARSAIPVLPDFSDTVSYVESYQAKAETISIFTYAAQIRGNSNVVPVLYYDQRGFELWPIVSTGDYEFVFHDSTTSIVTRVITNWFALSDPSGFEEYDILELIDSIGFECADNPYGHGATITCNTIIEHESGDGFEFIVGFDPWGFDWSTHPAWPDCYPSFTHGLGREAIFINRRASMVKWDFVY